MDQHLQGIYGFRCGNKQDIALSTAKTDVGCPGLWNGEMRYLVAILVEDCHAVASQVDVSTVVNCHTVRTHVGKHMLVRQGAVGLNVVS